MFIKRKAATLGKPSLHMRTANGINKPTSVFGSREVHLHTLAPTQAVVSSCPFLSLQKDLANRLN